ncbi:cation/multidrug efflux pump [Desulfosporosinus acidiphilus SJ4]|uniref:Cation/multidrug efflux pump n=1 Tax=Desulfosporosinus acidiphilus (strain DSM 22704 / JCM 16185 / SJ4) TaxID=646529 RepID=I4D905_DESAJ|nr:efflux RND transporter permease subunit [Desulfosporosinus acidiphilus]AFM42279.1 cation/multidrug efflux pump [Desulfosporosinus acidiphilus SJ4]
MNLTEISVKKPAAMWMVVVLLVALGIIGYTNMGANLLPSMNIPIISVTTTYSGANAEDIRKDIIKPIEDAVSGISGVDTINSTAKEGYGTVTVTFKMSADMNTAYLDVQKAVDGISNTLPANADKPVLFKMDTNAIPILLLSVKGDKVGSDELYNESDIIKQKIEKIPGVGNVTISGGEKKELMINLDKSALEYYGVSINTLISKLNSVNVNIPAGELKQNNFDQSVRVIGQFQSIEDAQNMMVPTANGGTVRLGDIAQISLEEPDATALARFNGQKTMTIIVGKQSDANVVEVANSVKKELESIKKTIPAGMQMDIAFDTTTFITNSLTEVKQNLIEGVIVTALVLFAFFRSFRSSLVVLVAIPTSLIATFFMMYKLNFTLNMMSLMGLSLVVGTLVDDSIVVIESIQRHLAMGKGLIRAAIDGRMEVGMAAIAISLCDIVIFAPISMMSGMIGQYFKEFGLTIVIATTFSLLVSFTITPMLSSRLLKTEKKQTTPEHKKDGFFGKVTRKYRDTLVWALEHRKRVLVLAIAGVFLSIALVPMGILKTEFVPTADQSSFTVNMKLAPGSTLEQTSNKVAKLENYLHNTKEVKSYFSMIGQSGQSNTDKSVAQIYVNLVPKNNRKKTQSQVASEVRSFGKSMTGVDFDVEESQSGGGASKPISISIKGDNQATLQTLSKQVETIVKSVPGVIDVGNSADIKSSELRVTMDSLAASQAGVSTADVGSAVRTALQGTKVGVYRTNDSENDITLKFMDGQIQNVDDIKSIKITNQTGEQIPLSQVASVVRGESEPSLSREDKQDVVTIDANLQGRTLGEVTQDIQNKLRSVTLPSGYSLNYGASQKNMADSFSSLGLALGASLALVYMILVVLYESFLTPAIRMVSLPLAIIGALPLLALTGQTLNMMSFIGLIMLEGLSSKNGTLLIDYTNTLMHKGLSLKEALIESGTTRLRPIIMTSATMIVSMLPVALSLGEGSEMKQSMAIVIIGGMVMSTLLSPIVLPVVYTLMDDLKNRISKNKKTINAGEVPQIEI